jgi:hypothetical protein
MKTTEIGNRSTLKCFSAFDAAGFFVSIPFGDGVPYDLVIDDGDKLYRVECKTARLRPDGAIDVWARSNSGRWYKSSRPRLYAGRVDFLAAYCPETDKVYVIPENLLSRCMIRLRISPTANNQTRKIRWASDFEIEAFKGEFFRLTGERSQ